MTAKTQIPYGPSRAAAEAFSHIMAKELEENRITVNVLLPGGPALTGFVPEHKRAEYSQNPAAYNLLPPEILDAPLLFLASPYAEGITGERIIGKEFDAWLAEKGYSELIDS